MASLLQTSSEDMMSTRAVSKQPSKPELNGQFTSHFPLFPPWQPQPRVSVLVSLCQLPMNSLTILLGG